MIFATDKLLDNFESNTFTNIFKNIKIDSYNKQLLVDSFNISHWNQIRNSITSFASP